MTRMPIPSRRPVDYIFPVGRQRKELGLCPTCGKEIRKEDFRDNLSMREFGISGMCQGCQDVVFKSKED